MENLAAKIEAIEKELNINHGRSMVIRDKHGNLEMILIHKPSHVA